MTQPQCTGLRRVILDAIQGIDPCEYSLFPGSGGSESLHWRLQVAGLIIDGPDYSCAPGSPLYAWSPTSLDAVGTDELLAIYDQLRPGVLEALGRGE